jgi:hypothetical protein
MNGVLLFRLSLITLVMSVAMPIKAAQIAIYDTNEQQCGEYAEILEQEILKAKEQRNIQGQLKVTKEWKKAGKKFFRTSFSLCSLGLRLGASDYQLKIKKIKTKRFKRVEKEALRSEVSRLFALHKEQLQGIYGITHIKRTGLFKQRRHAEIQLLYIQER